MSLNSIFNGAYLKKAEERARKEKNRYKQAQQRVMMTTTIITTSVYQYEASEPRMANHVFTTKKYHAMKFI